VATQDRSRLWTVDCDPLAATVKQLISVINTSWHPMISMYTLQVSPLNIKRQKS